VHSPPAGHAAHGNVTSARFAPRIGGLRSTGIHSDGWVTKNAEVLLPGGGAAKLVVRAQVLPRDGQRLDVVLDGSTVASEDAPGGLLNLLIRVPASAANRRLELRWAKAGPIAANDPREAVALLEYLDLVPLRLPTALRLPEGLGTPGLDYAGIYKDGWLAQEAHVVLAGGPAADLTVRADLLPAASQHLEISVGGDTVFSEAVGTGMLDVRIPLAAADADRRLDLRWATAAALAPGDPRQVAALLRFIGVAAGDPPPALRRFPHDLVRTNVQYSGIYDDGWLEQTSHVVLYGGAPGDLVLRADALPHLGQHLEVVVDGETLFSEPVDPGAVAVRVPVPPTAGNRFVELRWATAAAVGADDVRRVAARLRFVGIVSGRAPHAIRRPEDLADPNLDSAGVYLDGWLEQSSWVELAGGPPAELVVRALVQGRGAQHVDVVVDGRTVGSEAVQDRTLDFRVPVPATTANRRIELLWAAAFPISPDDPRQASAQLEFLGVAPVGSGTSGRSNSRARLIRRRAGDADSSRFPAPQAQ